MKLKNLIAPLKQNLRKAVSLLRYNPLSEQGRRSIATTLANRGRRKLENLEIPQRDSATDSNLGNVAGEINRYTFKPLPNPYPQYHKCDRNNPLGCDRALATLKQAPSAKFCSRCGFPVQLAKNKEIRGRKGIYRVQRFLNRQGNGRIYAAVHQNTGQPVIIKEYLLPRRSFEEEATRQQRKDIFERVANFQVAETISSDFRLIIPQEGISDRNQNRCYLIAPGNLAALPSLKTYLGQRGKMTGGKEGGSTPVFTQNQVIILLDQVLQSLEFLHSQRWQFTSGEIKSGLVHGNLSLDSLLIRETEVEFLIYLWNLSFWEDLFDPTLEIFTTKRETDDLVALGNIGLYLLAAKEITTQANYPLNPRNDRERGFRSGSISNHGVESNWRGIDPEIKGFLIRLLGLNSRFEDATTARRELRRLRENITSPTLKLSTSLETSDVTTKKYNWLIWLVFAGIFIGLGIFIFKKISSPDSGSSNLIKAKSLEDIKDIPSGNFTYSIVASQQNQRRTSAKLADIFKLNQTYINAFDVDPDWQTFTEILSQNYELNLILNSDNIDSEKALINKLDTEKIRFAIVNINFKKYKQRFPREDREQIINNLIAYSGLLVYVPFNGDCTNKINCEELGAYLNQKITLEQLRDIYTAKVSYWHKINPNIPNNIRIQAFAPKDTVALELFEQLLFENERDLADFRSAIASGKIQQLEATPMLRKMRILWQEGVTEDGTRKGAIGFDFQDIVYGQCNVYPLAVVNNPADFFPMLIKRKDGTGVNLFKDLNCKNNRPEYQLNENVFRNRQYPLAFSLNLLYLNSNDNQNDSLGAKITAIFNSKEFQCHLSHKKLIPLKLSEKDCNR